MDTLPMYLNQYAQMAPRQRLLGDRTGWLTTRQVRQRVEDTAGRLYGLGLRAGDWVVLRMEHSCDAVIMLLALQAIGVVAVLRGQRCGQRLPRLCAPVHGFLTRENGHWWLVNPDGEKISLPAKAAAFPQASDAAAAAMVIFTSGSTGEEKGVILSQENLISNLLASYPLGGYRPDDVALGALPMDHVFGLALLTGAIVLRHRLYLVPGSDVDTVLSTIEAQGITRMNGVPALYLNMAAKKGEYDLSTLRCGFIGGGPCTAEQFDCIEKELHMTLVPVYGMSECVGISCGDAKAPASLRRHGVGPFYACNEGKILLPDGTTAAAGQVGEVCVRGPQRMLGYCDDAQTKAVLDGEGFLHTGDLGFVDEAGILHLTGRKKDIIIRNGRNLSARRIEEALLRIPGVEDAMVVALPHGVQGEVPGALVRSDLPETVILARLTSMLTKNEIPMELKCVGSIPYTATGKPDKLRGKELLRQWRKASF